MTADAALQKKRLTAMLVINAVCFVLAGVAIAGAGLLWFAARQRAKKQAAGEPIEGSATRVEAKRGNGSTRTRRKSAASQPDAD